MTIVDIVLAAITVISIAFGAVRGFLRESLALLGWLVGLWLAWRYSGLLEPYLGGALAGTELQAWVARLIILVTIVVIAWIIASLLGYLVQRSGLTLGVDKILGAVFGLVRGAVIVGFLVTMGQAAKLQSEPWWDASLLIPLGEEMASILSGYLETGRQVVEDSLPDS